MIQALIKKEWKKSKFIILSLSFLILISLLFIFINLSNTLANNLPNEILVNLIKTENFTLLYYQIFIVILGLLLSYYQFNPEITMARIRLHFHLPLNQNFLIHFLIMSALFTISIIFFISNLIFLLIITNFYPIEIFYALNSKMFLAFILSLISYLTIAIFIVNPIKKIKVSILILSIFIFLLYISYSAKFFTGNNLYYFSTLIIFSYYGLLFNSFKTYTKGYTK